MKRSNKPVVFIVGSTASGKTEWAIRLAKEFGGIIINCDSIQVYKRVEIGSAKPSPQERAEVPHYLLDYVDAPDEMTAGRYSRDFFTCMENISEGTPVFVVGGTGFYFQAIEKGMYPVLPVPEEIKNAVALELESAEGTQRLYQELQSKDPVYGAKIHLSDRYRIGRAIEVIRSQGRSVTEVQNEFAQVQSEFPFPLLKIGISWERNLLHGRIRMRSQKMVSEGLIDEVKSLLDQGLGSWVPLQSVGYKETIQVLNKQMNIEDLAEAITISTRQLAKRQKTWFQRDKLIHWCDGGSGFLEARHLVEKFLNPFDPTTPKV